MRLLKQMLLIGLALPAMTSAASSTQAAPLPEAVTDAYVRAQDRVDIGGRSLNLYCVGEGARTVIFEAGGSDWSVTWALVQPNLGPGFRACSYDRAGLGYSDPSPLPRTPFAIVDDLHALVDRASIDRPFILVGHSLGGFNAKLYAALYPEDVAALVLVDPSEQQSDGRTRPMMRKQFGSRLAARSELASNTYLALLLERYSRCAKASDSGPLDPASNIYRRCTDPVRPQLGERIAVEKERIQAGQSYQAAQASEILNSVYGRRDGDAVYADLFRAGAFGDMPVIVLSHGRHDADDPLEAADFAAGLFLHGQTAQLSRRGRVEVVEGSGHNIQLERPDAIIDAIRAVAAALEPTPTGR